MPVCKQQQHFGLVKVWEAGSGRLVQTLEGPEGAIEWVRWHPKGNVLLAGSDDMTMWMWLALTGAYMQMFAGHSGPVTDGRFSADGKVIVSVGGDEDCSLRVWNPKSGECVTTIAGFPFHEARKCTGQLLDRYAILIVFLELCVMHRNWF
ncbi:WD40-repeat-containing domain protein [Dunaliella salina]|uniref:WD40-repeat-containing domain protein n=1 Tax=Dunaliella salina TaxID=3046 RepID=A0ABQ7FU99_DUNSA|nr:WD40-repeat-containing domain protein [Dunaliella salina]|eukprot:KAF5825567.1 WD40-repeat-containing domain protein [Dunaliella salina]